MSNKISLAKAKLHSRDQSCHMGITLPTVRVPVNYMAKGLSAGISKELGATCQSVYTGSSEEL